MKADEKLDLHLIQHLDFELPCSVRLFPGLRIFGRTFSFPRIRTQCPHPARSAVLCKACGAQGYMCETHRAHILALPRVTCFKCLLSGPALEIMIFLPLGS
jgi:hypothetical protein